MIADRLAAALKGIEECLRFLIDAVLVVTEMTQGRLPFPVRCLVLKHEHERLGLVPVL